MPTEEQERDARIDAERKNVEVRFRAMFKAAREGRRDDLTDDITAIATENVRYIDLINALEYKRARCFETMDGMDAALVDYDTTITELRLEILTLKAALYDLMGA